MGVKSILANLFSGKKIYKNKNVMMSDCNFDLTISDDALLVTLGQWLSVLPDSVETRGMGISVYSRLEVDEFLSKYTITPEQKNEIQKRMAYLFSSVGIGSGDFGILEDFDQEKLTFKMQLYKEDSDYDLQITWGDFFDHCAQLRIDDKSGKKYRYDYISASKDRLDCLSLETYEYDLGDGYRFHHYNSEFTYYGDLYTDKNHLSVVIKYPDSLDEHNGENVFVDEDLMEKIISGIKFPIDIQVVCQKITEAIKCDPEKLTTISITVKDLTKVSDEDQLTDKAEFNHGKFAELVMTRDGKKVAIDQFDNWSVKSNRYKVSGNAQKSISYAIPEMPVEDYKNLGDIPTLIDSANNEALDAKGMALTFINKKKSN